MSKVPPNHKITCDCDMQYITTGEAPNIIEKFFQAHPFMTGLITGYILKDAENGQKVVETIIEVGRKNYNNPKGWGRR